MDGGALVDAYAARIGIPRPTVPDRATLARIVEAHAAAIPFEGINPLLGVPVDLDPGAIAAKLIEDGRGGYCFEQNGLLRAALVALGYRVTSLEARVLWMRPPHEPTGRTHMLLRIDLEDGPVIVDVGFGGGTLTGVLDLVADIEQPTPHEPFRLTRDDGCWVLSIQAMGGWHPLYRFTDVPTPDIDYRIANWYMSTSPQSHFVFGLTCARALPGKRLALRNFDYAIHHTGGETEKHQIDSATALAELVEDAFAIRLPDRAAFIARIEQGVA